MGGWVVRLLWLSGAVKYLVSTQADSKHRLYGSEGPEECSRYRLNVNEGANGSCILKLHTEKQIIIFKHDPQNAVKEYALGRLNNLQLQTNETEVSLVNQNFTVCNAKTTNGGLYIIKEFNSKKCLAQVNLTVSDPPTSTSNAALPVRSTVLSPVLYIIAGVILVIIILAS